MVLGLSAQGQLSISRYVIGSAGSLYTGTNTYMSSVGESVVATGIGVNLQLTQGFEQPPYATAPTNTPTPTFENISVNAFSPDGDGFNDTWVIPGIDSAGATVVTIFNRWGDVLRSYENYNNADIAWDGTNQSGDDMPFGTYYYTVQLIDKDESYAGWLQLMK